MEEEETTSDLGLIGMPPPIFVVRAQPIALRHPTLVFLPLTRTHLSTAPPTAH